MTPLPPAEPDFEVLVVGAGITGIYQLYRALNASFRTQLLEAGDGVGGTWYWNRYPGARFDSESYTYGYLFSQELFEQWHWQERFAAQPEIERYLNHVIDHFDLRRHIHFGARVTSAVWDEGGRYWDVTINNEGHVRTRFLVAATGVLSVPYIPDVPGRDQYQGESYHTGLWPKEPVDFAGKRVAVIGTGSSGVQIVPAIVDQVKSLTVYQRTANWCTPLNNAPVSREEHEQFRENYQQICDILNSSPSGFLHQPLERATFDDPPHVRRAFFEKMWNSPGFAKLVSHYCDLMTNPEANRQWCDFIAEKIRSIVKDPATAEKLIPDDHYFGEKRPPFVTGYYEAFNRPNVSLVDLKTTPIVRMTPTGIETTDGLREFDIVVWATGFDFGTGALLRMNIYGRNGVPLAEYWADGPKTYLGLQTAGFPNLFFPGGPHAAAGNNPRYNSDQVDFVTETLLFLRENDYEVIEVDAAAEERWTSMVDRWATKSNFGRISYYFGTNIPGKPRKYLLNSGGRPKFASEVASVRAGGYKEFHLWKARAAQVATPITPSLSP